MRFRDPDSLVIEPEVLWCYIGREMDTVYFEHGEGEGGGVFTLTYHQAVMLRDWLKEATADQGSAPAY